MYFYFLRSMSEILGDSRNAPYSEDRLLPLLASDVHQIEEVGYGLAPVAGFAHIT